MPNEVSAGNAKDNTSARDLKSKPFTLRFVPHTTNRCPSVLKSRASFFENQCRQYIIISPRLSPVEAEEWRMRWQACNSSSTFQVWIASWEGIFQRIALPSLAADTTLRPRSTKSQEVTPVQLINLHRAQLPLEWPFSWETQRPSFSKLHIFKAKSAPPLSTTLPEGKNLATFTSNMWPDNSFYGYEKLKWVEKTRREREPSWVLSQIQSKLGWAVNKRPSVASMSHKYPAILSALWIPITWPWLPLQNSRKPNQQTPNRITDRGYLPFSLVIVLAWEGPREVWTSCTGLVALDTRHWLLTFSKLTTVPASVRWVLIFSSALSTPPLPNLLVLFAHGYYILWILPYTVCHLGGKDTFIQNDEPSLVAFSQSGSTLNML